MNPHQAAIQQDMDATGLPVDFAINPHQPSVIILWIQNHRHSAMYRGQFIWFGCDDGKTMEPFLQWRMRLVQERKTCLSANKK
jgi:hypothetical protein